MQQHIPPNRFAQLLSDQRIIGIIESILGVLVVSLIDLLIPPSLGLQQLNIYLFWVVVLGIAALHGPPAGYVVSILAALAALLLVGLRLDIGQPLATHVQIQPFLFFTCGILVSEVVRRHQRRARLEEERRQATATKLARLKEAYDALAIARNELEARIISQPVTVAVIAEATGRMLTQRSEELYASSLDLLRRLLETEASALYLVDAQGGFRLKSGLPENRAGRPALLPSAPTSIVLQRALKAGTVITIYDVVREQGMTATTANEPLMAGPLLTRDGQILGLIVIERLPFVQLNPANKRLFELILKFSGLALHNALLFERQGVRVL
jgi:hypothetical protein